MKRLIRWNPRIYAVIIVTLLAGSSLLAIFLPRIGSDDGSRPSGNPGNEIVMGVSPGSLSVISPSGAITQDDMTILANTRQGLFREKDGRIEPVGVEKIRVLDGGRRFLFDMARQSWSNGQAVSSDDYIESWKRLGKEILGDYDIKSFRAVDNDTLEVTTFRSTADLYGALTSPRFFPQYYSGEDEDTNSVIPGLSVTNGRFVLQSMDESGAVFGLNPNFPAQGDGQVERLVCRFIDKMGISDLSELDGMYGFVDGLDDIDSPEELVYNSNLLISPSSRLSIAVLSPNSKLLSDIDLRTALKLSVTRSSFEDSMYPGQELASLLMPYENYRSAHIYPRGIDELIAESETSKIENALKLIRKAGLTSKSTLHMASSSGSRQERYMSILKLIWESNLKIRIKTHVLDEESYKRAKDYSRYDIYIETVEWSPLSKRGLYKVIRDVEELLGSTYSNADDMIIEALQSIVATEDIIVPLMYESNFTYMDDNIDGWYVDAWSNYHFDNARIISGD
jgi:oligopeptide transport system substrate-binding protein